MAVSCVAPLFTAAVLQPVVAAVVLQPRIVHRHGAPQLSSWSDADWQWGSASGTARAAAARLRASLQTPEQRAGFLTDVGMLDPLDFEDSKVVLALKIQRATSAAKPRLETYGLDEDERAAWRQVMDDLAACRFEGHRGDELLADACIDRLGLIEAKRLSAL